MKKYTTYKTGGNVKIMYFPENEDELIELLKKLRKEEEKFYIIGNGSNLIVDDNDFNGSIINMKDLNKYKIEDGKVYCDAGVMLPILANDTINNSYSGLEWSISIPGTVGASVFNNAGAYGSDMSNVVECVKVLDEDFNIVIFNNEDCKFEYRDSIFKKIRKYIILSCVIDLEKSNKEEMLEKAADRRKRRIESQPLEYPSAGSVFRNPSSEFPAGKLIEDVGLKGKKIGGAMVSEKHANFIVNIDNASSNDIKNLIKLIKEKIKEEYNIDLKLEQEIINWE